MEKKRGKAATGSTGSRILEKFVIQGAVQTKHRGSGIQRLYRRSLCIFLWVLGWGLWVDPGQDYQCWSEQKKKVEPGGFG